MIQPISRIPATFLHLLVGLTASISALAQQGVPVVLGEVNSREIYRPVDITGTVHSPQTAQLSAATSGLVQRLHVDVGDRVKAGDLLLELDPELAQLQWQSGRSEQQRVEAALQDARRRLREAETLAPQRSIAKTAVRDLEAEVAEDQADFERAKADAGYRRALLDRHQLRAPFAGVISARQVETGEWVDPGQGVFSLVALQDMHIDFALAEDYLVALTPEATVEFELNAVPGKRYQGKVHRIVPVADPGARTFLLRVKAVNPDAQLLPGMSVKAVLRIPDPEHPTGLVVPRDATLRYPDGRVVVWEVERGDAGLVASERLVEIGQSFDGLVEIRGGIKAGAQVVIEGNESLVDGQPVRILESR